MLETCRFIIIHSEPLTNIAGFPGQHSFFSSSSSSMFSPIFCLAIFLTTNVDVWISSLYLYMSTKMVSHPERGLTSWNSWVSCLCSWHCSTIFILSDIPKVCPAPGCAFSMDSHYQIKILSLFLKSSGHLPVALGVGWSPLEGGKCRVTFFN